MCFFYSLSNKAKLKANQHYSFGADLGLLNKKHYPRAVGFSFPTMPVVTNHAPLKISFYRWGLIPHWIRDEKSAKNIRAKTLNARCETVAEKPSFRNNINQRCLILADGFFEWQHTKESKIPYFIHLPKQELFAFAGLFSVWQDKTQGYQINTFTILTTKANQTMAKIHNKPKFSQEPRMPVILQDDKFSDWLDPRLAITKFTDLNDLNLLCQPLQTK